MLGFRGDVRSTMDNAAGTPLRVARQPKFRAVDVEEPDREEVCWDGGNLKLSLGLFLPYR